MKLIDKAAVEAEIKRRLKVHMESNHGFSARYDELKDILSFINTLEVKEVDLDLEIALWANAIPEIRLDDVERLAEHFYKLGLKAKG